MLDRRRHALIAFPLLAIASLSACKDSSGPETIKVVGAFCASTTPRVERTGAGARVTLFVNDSKIEDVRQPNGTFEPREIRSCIQHECIYEDAAGATDQQLIDRCKEASG